MKEDSPAVHVAKGASYVFLQNMGSMVVQVIAFAIIARLITQTDMGVITALSLVTGLTAVLIGLGLPSAATKFIAESNGKGNRLEAAGAFYQILKISLVPAAIGSLLCFLFADSISFLLLRTTAYSDLFRLLSLDIFPSGLFLALYNSVIGLQKAREAALFNLFRLVGRYIMFIFFLLIGLGLTGLVLSWFIGDLANCLLYLAVIWRSLGSPSFGFTLTRLVQFSTPLYFSGIVLFLYGWFDQILILTFLPLADAGVYNVVLRAFGVLSGITGAVGTTIFPKYSELHGKYGMKSIENAVFRASRYVCYVAMPVAFGLAAMAKPLIALFVGEIYSAGSQPLTILSLFFAVTAVQAALSGLLLVMEKTLIDSGLTVLSVLSGMLMGLLLIPSMGLVGASLARGIAMVISLLGLFWMLRRRIALELDKEALWKSLVSSLLMTAAIVTMAQFVDGQVFLVLSLVVSLIVYLAMLRVLGAVKNSDVELIRSYLGGRLEFIIEPLRRLLVGENRL